MARTSSPLKILYSLPFNLISVPAYLLTSTRSPFLTSRSIFFPSSPVLPAPTATTMLSIGFSFSVSGMMIPPFLPFCSFSSMGSTRIRSPMGLTFNVIIYLLCCWLVTVSLSRFCMTPLPALRGLASPCSWPSQLDDFRHIKTHFVLNDLQQGNVRRAEICGVGDERPARASSASSQLADTS